MELKGAYKAIEPNLLFNAGIQIEADLTDGCPIFSWTPHIPEQIIAEKFTFTQLLDAT